MNNFSTVAQIPESELLQHAARAYGLNGHRYCESRQAMVAYTMQDGYYGPAWNPFKDDSNALRLAVKCLVDIRQAQAMYHDLVGNARYHQDPYASTRYAIVYAVVLTQLKPVENEL